MPDLGEELQPSDSHPQPPLYEALPRDVAFRTATLLRGAFEDEIKCTLQVACLRHPPDYEALSHEWGRTADTNERSNQVSMMAKIYRSAEMVISWLGLEMQDAAQSAMVFLSTLLADIRWDQRRAIERVRSQGRIRPHYEKLLRTLEKAPAAPWSDVALLVPGNAKEDDLIYQFQNSDAAAVVRPFSEGWFHSIVGGALILR
ncbi:hypothetical protein C8A03DRAFT_33592 [Achaetomium macrosporum]|uniref:Heterokaryon incompatibility domain-containing protein n=1 Tax=Achaetomium macrosporum TaxID=79813 RepID=A0AAN7HCG0_9PEZI|nr:hypothetical protein C8A03DRAFT_33592 [Achaetomium macrosporum]